jgi:hypothetical protein
MKPIDVLVLGGGPAGLAAAARLLERAPGRVRVRMVHMASALGGKAVSQSEADGFVREHGWHMVVGFYDRLRALMARAGIDDREVLATMHHKSHCYEPWSQKIHTMSSEGGPVAVGARFSQYDGLPFDDRMNFGRFMAQAFSLAMSGDPLTEHDDICFTTWAVEHGLRPHVTRYSIFRFLRLAYFNFPEQISAYHVLRTMKLMSTSDDAELFVCRGGYTDRIWEPIGRYVRALGASIEGQIVATDWMYDGDRVVGVRVGTRAPVDGAWPIAPGSERTLAGFDYVLSTIPVDVLTKMNRDDARMWQSPYFKRLLNLRSAATLGLTLVLKKPIASTFRGPVHGFPSPFNFFVDMKPYWPDLTKRADARAVLVFGGQEAGFESWSDDQILDFTLANVSRCPEIGPIARSDILQTDFRRNRAPWERLMISEPGVQQFRPGPRTPFANLFVAGDWVRNSVDVIAMEGAVTSGRESADALLAAAGVLA